MKNSNKADNFRPLCYALAAAAIALVLAELAMIIGIRYFRQTWTGDIFGGGSFNWKDAMLMMTSFIVAWLALILTFKYAQKREQIRRNGKRGIQN